MNSGGYGWVIMLVVIAATNIISRLATKKKAQAAELAVLSEPSEPAERVPVRARKSPRPIVKAAPRAVACPVAPPVVREAVRVVAAPAAMPAGQPSQARAKPVATPGRRWTAVKMRNAFVASEILGPPRALNPALGSAHEAC